MDATNRIVKKLCDLAIGIHTDSVLLAFQSTPFAICTACFDIKETCVFLTGCFYLLILIVRINRDYFSKQKLRIALCVEGGAVFVVRNAVRTKFETCQVSFSVLLL